MAHQADLPPLTIVPVSRRLNTKRIITINQENNTAIVRSIVVLHSSSNVTSCFADRVERLDLVADHVERSTLKGEASMNKRPKDEGGGC